MSDAGKIIDAKGSTPNQVAAARQKLIDYKREEPVLRKALTDIVQGQQFDPARFAEEIRKLTGGKFTDEQIAEAAKAFDAYGTTMRELRLKDISNNVANRKLGDRGLYYVKGMECKYIRNKK